MTYKAVTFAALIVAGISGPTSVVYSDTLVDIYELALENDPVLRAAEATFNAGQEAEVLGRSALLPQISASAEYGESDQDSVQSRTFNLAFDPNQPPTSIISRADDSTDDETELYALNLSQNIINMPAWFSFKQGVELSRQAEAIFSADQQTLIVRTVEAYANVMRGIDNLTSSRAEEAAFKRQFEQTQQRFEVGLIAITDVHEARAAYDLATVGRLTDEGNLGIAYEALTVLTGQAHSQLWLLNEEYPVVDPNPADRADWVEYSLENNHLLRASEFAAEAARQRASAAKAEHLPKLTGTLTYSDFDNSGNARDNTLNIDKPFSTQTDGYSWNLRLSMPLYSGGGISASRRQAQESYIASRETHTSILRNTIQKTRSLHLAVTTDVQRVRARKQATVSAQSALDATEAGYEVGTRNVVDVLQAQRILFNALRDYSNSRYDYVINYFRLLREAGMLGPQHIYELNKWLQEPPAPTSSSQQHG